MRVRLRQFFATDPRPPSLRDILWMYVALFVGSFFLAGPQLKQMEGFDVKAALNTLLAFLGQSYLALLLVWFLGWLIYRRGYARGLQDGRVTERAWREEVQRKFGALRKRCGARLYGQATRLNHLSPTLETPARSWAG